MALSPGHVLAGKYRLLDPLGEGGMGVVYRAHHEELETDVAIKVMHDPASAAPSELSRFKREARAAARLRSPHVAPIFDYGVDGGMPYIVMELLEGEDLGQEMEREKRLAPARVVAIVKQVAKALRIAHEAGLVHRDLKPANVFLARTGGEEIVKVLDFGIAKEQQPSLVHVETTDNLVLGSPAYMAPEQARGMSVDARADLWSLGVMTFEMLTGELPFEGSSVVDLFMRVCSGPSPRPSSLDPSLAAFDTFFERALSREPDGRFQSARALADELEAVTARHGAGAVSTVSEGRIANPALASTPRLTGRDGDTLTASAVRVRDAGTPSKLDLLPAPSRLKQSRWLPITIGTGVLLILAAWVLIPRPASTPAAAHNEVASAEATGDAHAPMPSVAPATMTQAPSSTATVAATVASAAAPVTSITSSGLAARTTSAPLSAVGAGGVAKRPPSASPLPPPPPPPPAPTLDPVFGLPVRK